MRFGIVLNFKVIHFYLASHVFSWLRKLELLRRTKIGVSQLHHMIATRMA